jgi:hypothetical protein
MSLNNLNHDEMFQFLLEIIERNKNDEKYIQNLVNEALIQDCNNPEVMGYEHGVSGDVYKNPCASVTISHLEFRRGYLVAWDELKTKLKQSSLK